MGAPASTVTVRGSSESDALTYTTSVQEDMERQRRVATFHAVAGELLQQALGIKEHAGAGRPSLKTVRLRVVRGVLLTALCGDPSVDKEAPLNSASLHKWLCGDHCQRVCNEKDMLEELKIATSPVPAHSPGLHGGGGAVAPGPGPAGRPVRSSHGGGGDASAVSGEGDDASPSLAAVVAQPEFDQHVHDIMDNKGSGMYVWRNYRLRTLFRAWLHVWAADGSHMGWRDIPDWLQTVKAMSGLRLDWWTR